MRFCLWCVWTSWILTLHTAAQHPPDRVEGGVQPGWRRQSPGTPSPSQPAAERGAGGRLGGRRAPLPGPHVCGARCCVGWTLSPKTKRCTKPRCLPRCHNNAVCHQSNRCVCRRGFHGYRCEVSTVTLSLSGRPLTSIRPTSDPHLDSGPSKSPPGQEPGARTEPAGSTTLSPSVTPDSAPDESVGGVGEQNRASSKSPQVGRRAARTEEEFHFRTGESRDSQDVSAGLSPKLKAASAPKDVPESLKHEGLTKRPNPSSLSWSEGTEPTDSKENSETENKMKIRTTSEIHNLETNQSLELNAGPSEELTLNLESKPGLSGEKVLDTVLTGEEVKKQSLSLREAQAVLLRKTLSRGGRGDKMAALLMKHIEKERKKVLRVTSSSSSSSSTSSSSVKSSVKSFHTQKGQYTVHFMAPAGWMLTAGVMLVELHRQTFPSELVETKHEVEVVSVAAVRSFSPTSSTVLRSVTKLCRDTSSASLITKRRRK